MPTYKVQAEFEMDGVVQEVGSQVELSEEAAGEYLSDGRIAPVAEEGAEATDEADEESSDEEEDEEAEEGEEATDEAA